MGTGEVEEEAEEEELEGRMWTERSRLVPREEEGEESNQARVMERSVAVGAMVPW